MKAGCAAPAAPKSSHANQAISSTDTPSALVRSPHPRTHVLCCGLSQAHHTRKTEPKAHRATACSGRSLFSTRRPPRFLSLSSPRELPSAQPCMNAHTTATALAHAAMRGATPEAWRHQSISLLLAWPSLGLTHASMHPMTSQKPLHPISTVRLLSTASHQGGPLSTWDLGALKSSGRRQRPDQASSRMHGPPPTPTPISPVHLLLLAHTEPHQPPPTPSQAPQVCL